MSPSSALSWLIPLNTKFRTPSLSAGLRCGELLALRWDDLEGNIFHVRRSLAHVRGELIISTPKTEKGMRRVTLSPNVLEVLHAHRTLQLAERALLGKAWLELDLIFTKHDGGYVTPRNLAEMWYRLQDNAKVRRVRLHDLRHLNVSIRRKLGQDAKLIADQIGHTDPAFTTRLCSIRTCFKKTAKGLLSTSPAGSRNALKKSKIEGWS